MSIYKKCLILALSIVSLGVSGCKGIGVKLINAPSALFDGKIQQNILYDPANNLSLDIYRADVKTKKPLPVIVFLHGGRWTEGSRNDYKFVGANLALEGFLVVIPDYRKYPEVRFPTFIEDSAAAVKWVHDNIDQYGGNEDTIFIAGHSSGAHMGALIVSDERYFENSPDTLNAIKGFAGMAGPYSFTPDEPDLIDMFGPPENYPQMQVTTFINDDEAPMLLLHGTDDETVYLSNLEKVKKAVNQNNGMVKTIIYPDINHIDIITAFSGFLDGKAPVLKDISSFFHGIETQTSAQ